jgi:RNA polymerase sigma-70 factor (ECF subfamily)
MKDGYPVVVAASALRPRVTVLVNDASPAPVHDPTADLELMARVAAAQPEAQRELVERVIRCVRARARKFTHNDADADDATQISIIQILRSARTFRGEGRLQAWCERITVRTTIRQERRRAQALALLADVDPDVIDPDVIEQPPVGQEQTTEARCVWSYLEELSDDRQQALQLWAIGHSVDEIAAQTNASPNTVKDRLRMARRQLRQSMRQREAIASIKRNAKRKST